MRPRALLAEQAYSLDMYEGTTVALGAKRLVGLEPRGYRRSTIDNV